MSWFADLAGRAETLLNNLDEQTGAALRNHNVSKKKNDRDFGLSPEPSWGPKKRPIPRNLKKITTSPELKSNSPSRKPSPTSHQSPTPSRDNHDFYKEHKSRKSPLKKSTQYSLHNCPKTLVGDVKDSDILMDHFGLKQRRYSLPSDLELINNESLTYKMQNLEVENAMLKNELNVMNREVSELLDRLRKTEDGNDLVNGSEELSKTHIKLGSSEVLNQKMSLDKEMLISQLDQLKHRINELTSVEVKYKELNQQFEKEVTILKDRNLELEDIVKQMNEKTNEKDSVQIKIENELRHAQSVIKDLQSNLERSQTECMRLEKDWEAYKLRVKSMLHGKDNEIKSLREGMNLTEDTKMLIEQLETLKDERAELSEAVTRVRGECNDMKQHIEHLESRHSTAERAVAALRDALRDERSARNRAEMQCIAMGKEMKNIQIETGQTIASLRTALRDKESELCHLRDTASTVRTTDTSALNVADYDVTQDSMETEKIHYLTQTLVQRQGKIDSLMADNNMLRIQLEKLESKFKSEVHNLRTNYSHSVVHVQDNDVRPRPRVNAESTLYKLSMRIGFFIRRYPLFRIFIFVYMIGLHLWVITVLFTSTPEDILTRPTKS